VGEPCGITKGNIRNLFVDKTHVLPLQVSDFKKNGTKTDNEIDKKSSHLALMKNICSNS